MTEDIPAAELDAIVAQLEEAGLIESYTNEDGQSGARRRYPRAVTDDLDEAWLHEATLDGWYVGQPMEHPERNE